MMHNALRFVPLLGACLLALVGCMATDPTYQAPVMRVPESFRNVPPAQMQAVIVSAQPWWTQYGSTELNGLIDRGLADNSELRIARLQIAQARIRADQVKAGNMPTVSAPLRVSTQGAGGASNTQQSAQLSLQGIFRLDVWGEQKASVAAAEFQVQRAMFERGNVQRNMVGGMVSAYISYLLIADSLVLAHENESVAKDLLQTVERRLALGDATQEELELQLSALAMQQASIPVLENELENYTTIIARLAGALPAELVMTDRSLDALLLPSMSAGLPATLLLQRPDIRLVEARMRAANANIEVARARLLPPVDLSAQLGYSGLALSQLLQPQSLFWAAAASLAVTIFDGGRLDGDKAFAQSFYEEMVETYRQTIYQAIREVESAVSAQRTSSARLEAQKRSVRAALGIFKLATDSYRLGAADMTTLLDTRKNYQRSLDEMLRIKAEVLRANATLAQALGLGSDGSDTLDTKIR